MKRFRVIIVLLAVMLLSACAAKEVNLPEPSEFFGLIQNAVHMPEMADVSDDFMEANTGIEPDDYDSAVYFILTEGTSPDEIIIIKAKDSATADDIQSKLEARLAYKEKSAERYLTEYMPVIKNGIIRRDGLTVSLIVSEQASQISEFYNNFK